MSCERHTSAIVDHACGAEIAADAAAHLTSCPHCGRLFDEQVRLLQDLDRQLQAALKIEPSARFVSDVVARVERSPSRWRNAIWWGVPAAAAVLMLVTLGTLRDGDRLTADRPHAAVRPSVPSTPASSLASSNPTTRTTVETSRLTDSRRVDRRRGVVKRPRTLDADALAPAAQSRAIARYLTLVRRGVVDGSALIRSNETGVARPADLAIAPLSIESLVVTNVEHGIGPGVDRSGSR
jgi:hypothetical protein